MLDVTGRRTTGIAIACATIGSLPVWLLAGFAPQIGADLGFDDGALGAFIAAYFGLSALGSLAAGTLVERIGWRDGVLMSAALSAATMLGMGILAVSWPLLMLFLAVGAAAFVISQPAANVALAEGVALRRQGTAFGIKQAALPLSTLLVGVAVPAFTGSPGWRWAFVAAAALAAALAVGVGATAARPRLRRAGARDTADGGLTTMRRWSRRPVRLKPALLVLAAGAGVAAGATSTIGGFLVVYAVASGLSMTLAGHLLAAGSVACLVSRLVTGVLADRRGRRHLLVVSLMMLGGSAGFALLAADGATWVIFVGTLLAFGIGWSYNGLYAFAIVLNYNEYPAVATGVAQTAIATGAAAGPLLFGLAASVLGYGVAWTISAALLAGAAACIAVGRRLLRAGY